MTQPPPGNVPSTEVSALAADAVLLDVREDDEWAAGRAPHAMHVPLGQLADRLDELPTDTRIHVVCRSGGRSARATAFLNANGRNAVNVDGGMKAWHEAGRPMVSDHGDSDPTVR